MGCCKGKEATTVYPEGAQPNPEQQTLGQALQADRDQFNKDLQSAGNALNGLGQNAGNAANNAAHLAENQARNAEKSAELQAQNAVKDAEHKAQAAAQEQARKAQEAAKSAEQKAQQAAQEQAKKAQDAAQEQVKKAQEAEQKAQAAAQEQARKAQEGVLAAENKAAQAAQSATNAAQNEADKLAAFSLTALLNVLNDVRANPSKYVDRIQKIYLDNMDNQAINRLTRVKANEGFTAFRDAQNFLKSARPLPAMQLDEGLTLAAYLHSKYLGKAEVLSHTGENGSTFDKRILNCGSFTAGGCGMAENILNLPTVDSEQFILDFVIDDGVPSRGHRMNIFNKDMSKVGLGIARQGPGADFYFTMDFTTGNYAADKSKLTPDLLEITGLNRFRRGN